MEVATQENGSNDSLSGVKRPRLEQSNVGGEGGDGGHTSWVVKASRESHDCVNPVRSCEENYFKEALEKRDKTKSLIKLSIGGCPHYCIITFISLASWLCSGIS